KQFIMKEDMAILVEGQMDLVMSHQAGLTNAVASSGTALTEDHLRALKRFSERIVMAFDGDEAGFAASERGFNLALSLGMDVRVAKLPQGLDPADLAAKDPDALKGAIAGAKHLVDFYLDSLLERGLPPRDLQKEVSKRVLPYVALIQNRIEQAQFVGRVAAALGVDEAPVFEEVKKRERSAFETKEEVKEKAAPRPKEARIREKLIGIIWWQEGEAAAARTIDVEKANERYQALSAGGGETEFNKPDLILQAEVYYRGSERLKEELEELFVGLEQELLERDLASAMAALRDAERKKDEAKIGETLERCHEISKKLNEVKHKFKAIL
ncbi:toprim domain-containing protein, partial [Candidatus Parcubacteria bacterium]|nr:toprim domain-containing protein [Candidatus Parcubacteria bacterium]